MMNNIVTVTCDRDVHQIVLQSHSLDKFLIDPCVHWVIVESSTRPISEWEALLLPLYKKHTLRLLDNGGDKFPNDLPGYARQQLMKLCISQFIQSEYYLILDSKDVLLRPTKFSDWGYQEGSGVVCYNNNGDTLQDKLGPNSYYTPFVKLIEETINVELPDWFWAPLTPFRVQTNVVKKMLETIDLANLFDYKTTGVIEVSEFILYRYFSNFSFTEQELNTKYMWASESIDVDVDVLKNEQYKSVSFHRWYIVNNGSRLNRITDTLINDIGLQSEYVLNAFDIAHWNEQTLTERGHIIFEQSNFGFRKI